MTPEERMDAARKWLRETRGQHVPAIVEFYAAQDALRDAKRIAESHVLTCGYCGRRLFKVVADRKSVWTHEALEDGQICRLITF